MSIIIKDAFQVVQSCKLVLLVHDTYYSAFEHCYFTQIQVLKCPCHTFRILCMSSKLSTIFLSTRTTGYYVESVYKGLPNHLIPDNSLTALTPLPSYWEHAGRQAAYQTQFLVKTTTTTTTT